MKPVTASCGLLFPSPEDISAKLAVVTSGGFDFMAVPVIHPRYRLPEKISTTDLQHGQSSSLSSRICSKSGESKVITRDYAFTRSDLLLMSSDWSSLVVGIISRDVNLESADQEIRRTSEQRLARELNFSSHLGLAAILVSLRGPRNINLSRIMYTHIIKGGQGQIWLRVPLNNPKTKTTNGPIQEVNEMSSSNGEPENRHMVDTWTWWDEFRGCANVEKRLFLALTLDGQEPDERRLQRWLGEPVKCLILSTSLFIANKKNYPVLPRVVQNTVKRFVSLKVQFIIEGRMRGFDARQYQQYMNHLVQQPNQEHSDPVSQFSQGYEDFLQSPLQPLMDNLESGTYEVFERDPVKYAEYEKAMLLAFTDRVSPDDAPGKKLIVMVLGAGRGPLVRAALKAAEQSGRKIKVYAVEKNPNAVVTLLTQKEEIWGDAVDVISNDMREWRPICQDSSGGEEIDVRADIVISELLGSFGDNELSPECLYAAENLFKPDAISIPSSYTSWIGPLQSSKLYQEVRSSVDTDKNPLAHFETPYVVHFQNRTELDKPQPLFTFHHPSSGSVDTTRYEVRQFAIDMDSVLHGFGGYFECTLYKDIMISINPATHSKGMFSWFPIFFPLKAPISLQKGDKVELHFWRLNNSKQVWYEWCLTKPVHVPIHNPNGRSYEIGL